MKILFTILLTAAILAIQHYASTRKHWQLGGIFPLLYAIFAIWFKLYIAPDFRILSLIAVEFALLSIWAEGREVYKKKLQSTKVNPVSINDETKLK